VISLSAALASLGSPQAQAIERYAVPDESPSGPFYARLERGYVHMTDQWVAIAFYRDTGCVRSDFNLMNFFVFDNIPAIFGCPLTVHGFEIWKNSATTDPGPRQSKLFGNGAVPIWFVSVSDFGRALPGITMTELAAMPSLKKGYATFFEETLHPFGAAKQAMLHISAYGWLEAGGTFQYQATEAAGILRTVRIEIR
jgi:hypothetical protein